MRRLADTARIDERMRDFRLIRKAQRHIVLTRTMGESFGLVLDAHQAEVGAASVAIPFVGEFYFPFT